MKVKKIRPKERDAIIKALRSGVVPNIGLQHIQVGRALEIKNLLQDIESVADGGSSFRVVIGEYGSGKTFFMNLVRSMALEKKLVTAHADMSPERKLHSTNGQAQSLYRELMKNIATRAKPEGGALLSIIEKFISSALQQSKIKGISPEETIAQGLQKLTEHVGGYDFAEVVGAYWEGYEKGDENLKANAVRWLRGEFTTKTDSKAALGVRRYIDDASMYDQLKLLSLFVRLAGYAGLYVCLDELVNLYNISNSISRKNNYEQLLRILNDCLQTNCEGLAFILGGTPDFLLDTRRGLYSYEALQSRLATNTFASSDYIDLSGPVINLSRLTPEDMLVLLERLRSVYAQGEDINQILPDKALPAFLSHCNNCIGDAYFRTPRNTIKAFLDMLAILEQNPNVTWEMLVQDIEISPDIPTCVESPIGTENELSSFRI